MSLVPIINSDFTGKLKVGDSQILFEATGTDEESVNLAANIFAQNLYERGFNISSVNIVDGSRKFTTPRGFNEKVKITQTDVEQLTGLKLSQAETKKLLEKARYAVNGNIVTVPDYRRDTLHVFDVIEDIAIMYGFNNIQSAPLESYTTGSKASINVFIDKLREISLGLGYVEILSPILSSKKVLEEKMEESPTKIVEIENVMSETFSALRNWLTPIMLEVLSKNKHNDYPQKVFEQGLVSIHTGSGIKDREKIAFAISHTNVDFTEVKQCADAILNGLGINYSISPYDSKSFIKGRVGKITCGNKEVGIIGEISPKVLVNWQLEMPVATLELDLTELKKIISNS